MSMTTTNTAPDDSRPEDDRKCDGCGVWMHRGEQANPTTECEAFCAECFEGEAAPVPAPADPGRTVRIPNVSMAALVFGEVV